MKAKKIKKNNFKILAVIPAREGSRRISKKNTRFLDKKPMIVHTIEAAKKSKYIKRIIVSTDSPEIMDIAKKNKVEAILQPSHLSKSKSKIIDVILHILSRLKKENYWPDFAVLLQPTTPLRNNLDIDKAIEIFLNNKCDSVVGISEIKRSFFWAFTKNEEYLKPLLGWKNFQKRSQDFPKLYVPNGAVFVSTPEFVLKNKSFYSQKSMPYIMPKERGIDIDEEIDFIMTEHILKNGLHKIN